jgi:SAM-dependent methyltransferase
MDESEAQTRLEAIRAAWDARAPGWNERNLKGWDTEETTAWWRDEWLAEVRPFLPAPGPEVRLLDAGCGNGQLSVLYAKQGYTVRGCDFSLNMAQYARDNAASYGLVAPQIEFTCASIDALGCAGGAALLASLCASRLPSLGLRSPCAAGRAWAAPLGLRRPLRTHLRLGFALTFTHLRCPSAHILRACLRSPSQQVARIAPHPSHPLAPPPPLTRCPRPLLRLGSADLLANLFVSIRAGC